MRNSRALRWNSGQALRQSSGRGFTLIELLVVIAIIALLISILLPSLKQAKELAKEMICKTNLRGINTALNLYVEDTQGYLPQLYYSFMPGTRPGLTGEQWSSWRQLLTRYPSNYMQDIYGTGVWLAPISYVDDIDLYVCPMDENAPEQSIARRGSYGINGYMGYCVPPHDRSNVPYYLYGTQRPDQMYLMTESWHWYTSLITFNPIRSYSMSNPPPYADGDIQYYSTRHGGDGERGFILFHDGHIDFETYQTIGLNLAPATDSSQGWLTQLPWTNGMTSSTWRGVPPISP